MLEVQVSTNQVSGYGTPVSRYGLEFGPSSPSVFKICCWVLLVYTVTRFSAASSKALRGRMSNDSTIFCTKTLPTHTLGPTWGSSMTCQTSLFNNIGQYFSM